MSRAVQTEPVNPMTNEVSDTVRTMPKTLNDALTSGARRASSSTSTARPTETAANGAGTRRTVATWVMVATESTPPLGKGTLTNSSAVETAVRIRNAGSQSLAGTAHVAGSRIERNPPTQTKATY